MLISIKKDKTAGVFKVKEKTFAVKRSQIKGTGGKPKDLLFLGRSF